MEAHRGYLPVARGKHCYALYKTRVKVCWGWINFVEDDPSPNPWNHRLAPMSEKGLKILVRESLISLFEGKTLNPCDCCLFGKNHRVSFHNLKWKENMLELTHSYVCSPMRSRFLYDDRYFVSFIDDVSHNNLVYILKAKSLVFQKC